MILWYNRKSFKTPNKHGNYNGFNLVGIDPLPFFKHYQTGKMITPEDFIKQLPEIVKLRVMSNSPPSILELNPSLCTTNIIDPGTQSWVCSLDPMASPYLLPRAMSNSVINLKLFLLTTFSKQETAEN